MYRGELMEEAPAAELYKSGLHPYTELLFSSVAGTGAGGVSGGAARASGGGAAAAGQAAQAAADGGSGGAGCSFAGRCPLASEQCFSEHPRLREAGSGHWVRCFHR
jgi:ABC-type dipeptide/oligopeptide/nickel transport system ATPase component